MDNPELVQHMWSLLKKAQEDRLVPSGYGFRPGEQEYGEYEEIEIIRVGRRASDNDLRVILPESVWLPRTVLWLQALEIMTFLIYETSEII